MSANGILNRTVEQAGEIASKAWDTTKKEGQAIADSAVQQISWSQFLGIDSVPTDAQTQQKEEENIMWKTEGYKKILRDLDKLKGKDTNEKEIDEKVQKQIDEDRKKVRESWARFTQSIKSESSRLGEATEQPQKQEQEDQPLKASHDRTNPEELAESEPVLPGSKGKKPGRQRMMRLPSLKQRMEKKILARSQTKAETGRNQGIG